MHGMSEWLTTMPAKRSWCLNVSLVLFSFQNYKKYGKQYRENWKIVGDADVVLQVRKLINHQNWYESIRRQFTKTT